MVQPGEVPVSEDALGKMRGEGSLLFFQPRNVSVANEDDAIGGELKDLIHSVRESVGRLIGQAIDEVDVDAVKTEIARGKEQVPGHFEWLNTVDGFLHVSVKILDAHAEAVEAELAESFQMLARGDARVNLDADFRVWCEMEMRARESK